MQNNNLLRHITLLSMFGGSFIALLSAALNYAGFAKDGGDFGTSDLPWQISLTLGAICLLFPPVMYLLHRGGNRAWVCTITGFFALFAFYFLFASAAFFYFLFAPMPWWSHVLGAGISFSVTLY